MNEQIQEQEQWMNKQMSKELHVSFMCRKQFIYINREVILWSLF